MYDELVLELKKTLDNTINDAMRLMEISKKQQKEIERLQNRIKQATDYIKNAEGNDINYVYSLLKGHPIEIEEQKDFLEEVLYAEKENK